MTEGHLNEIERRRADVGYVKTADGLEVDFLVRDAAGATELVQVCADPSGEQTRTRELRALAAAAVAHPRARRKLLLLTHDQTPLFSEAGVDVQPAYEWLLARPGERRVDVHRNALAPAARGGRRKVLPGAG